MTPTGATQSEFNPIFDWSGPKSRKLKLSGFVAASAVLHALCFYLFQIIYPTTVALLPPPARVNMINPETEEGRVLLRWLEAEDPALSSTTQRPADAPSLVLPRAEHIPSYVDHRPVLKEPLPYQPDLRVPSAQPPGPVRITRAVAPPAVTVTSTNVILADAELLGPAEGPAPKFSAATKSAPQSAEFRLAVDAGGAVRHCFLQRSSEDPALDAQAREFLLLRRFPHVRTPAPGGESSLVWTTATFAWGSEIGPGPALSEEPAAP